MIVAMKITLVFTLLCAILLYCVALPSRFRPQRPRPYRGYSRNSNSYQPYIPRRVPGLTSDGQPCLVPNGCIQLPDNKDLMTRTTFQNKVVGVRQYVMYRFNQPFGDLSRHEYLFSVQGDDVHIDIKGRINETDCLYLNILLGTFVPQKDLALVKSGDMDFYNIDGIQQPVFYFMSDNPSVYQIMLTCLYASTIRNGFCEGDYFVNIILTQDPPNSPPFKQIEEELCRKLGLSMDDPSNKLIYVGEACPAQ